MRPIYLLCRRWPVAGLLFLLMLAVPTARAQAPAWQMATFLAPLSGSPSFSNVRATTSDANGNIYLVGDFGSQAHFGPITLTTTAGKSLFVAKYNAPTSAFVWVQQVNIGGNFTNLEVTAVALQGTNVYVAGAFYGTVGFGSTILNSSGDYNAFVAKVVDAGSTAQFGWVQQSTGTAQERATGLAVNGTAVYLTGTFEGSGATSTAVLGTTTLASASPSKTDIFVAKLLDAGTTATFGWALRVGGSGSDKTNALVVNGSNLYLGGYVSGQAVVFGTIVAPITTSTQPGFVAKLVDNGTAATFAWVQVPGGQTEVYALAVSGSNVYVAGALSDNFFFTTFGSVQLVSVGRTDGFVAKLVDAGASSNFVWARNFGSSDYDEAFAVAVSNSAVYVGGYRNQVVYLSRYTDTGTTSRLNWELTSSNFNAFDAAYAVAVVPGGQVFVAGRILPPSIFAPLPLVSLPRIETGFLASVIDAIPTATTAAQTSLNLTLAPNPARTSTTVTLPAVPGATTATLALFDALGRAVRTATVAMLPAGLRHELPLANLPAGLYALRVTAGPATATRRLAVE